MSAQSISVRATVVVGTPRWTVTSARVMRRVRWTATPGGCARPAPGETWTRPSPCGARMPQRCAADRWLSTAAGPADAQGERALAVAARHAPVARECHARDPRAGHGQPRPPAAKAAHVQRDPRCARPRGLRRAPVAPGDNAAERAEVGRAVGA